MSVISLLRDDNFAMLVTLFLFLPGVENYERLEADKKKQVHKKRRFEGPTIRYHSVLMPLVSHSILKEENVDVEGLVSDVKGRSQMIWLYVFVTHSSFSWWRLDQDIPQSAPQNPSTLCQQPAGGLCSRSYITFSDDEAFEAAFPPEAQASPQLPVQEVCPVTHKTALYRDPVTDIPYANARAFRIIREAYRKYVAAHGFPNTSVGSSGQDSSAAKGARQKMLVKQSAVGS